MIYLEDDEMKESRTHLKCNITSSPLDMPNVCMRWWLKKVFKNKNGKKDALFKKWA